MKNIRGESLSKISILKDGNVYKLKLFFKARRIDLGQVRSIPVMEVVDFFS